MSEPFAPIPADATDRDRMENVIFHLGEILALLMKARRTMGYERRQVFEEMERTIMRASQWLGVTLWDEELKEKP